MPIIYAAVIAAMLIFGLGGLQDTNTHLHHAAPKHHTMAEELPR